MDSNMLNSILLIVTIGVTVFVADFVVRIALLLLSYDKSVKELKKMKEDVDLKATREIRQIRGASEAIEKESRRLLKEAEERMKGLNESLKESQTLAAKREQEARDARAAVGEAKEELAGTRAKMDQDREEARESLEERDGLLADKEREIESTRREAEGEIRAVRANIEAVKMELARLEDKKTAELKIREDEIKNLTDEIVRTRKEREEFDKKRAELKENEEEFNKRRVELKENESDLARLEEAVTGQKKASGRLKQQLEESGMRLRLLNEKIKGGAEMVARFAEGKEFDEFRKSIHLDEIVQRYEDEIKELRIKNMELEQRENDE